MPKPVPSSRRGLRPVLLTLLLWSAFVPIAALGLGLTHGFSPSDPWWVDAVTLTALDGARIGALDIFFAAVTWAGSLYVLAPLGVTVVLWLLWRGHGREALLLAASLGGAALASALLKAAIARPRPGLAPALIPMPADWSFPSGHTIQVTAFSLALVLIARRLGWRAWPALAGALTLTVMLVATSRLYLQVHYPTDVAAGLVLAAAWGYGLAVILRTPPASTPVR
jgi:undecaprenyl-diphosphatase